MDKRKITFILTIILIAVNMPYLSFKGFYEGLGASIVAFAVGSIANIFIRRGKPTWTIRINWALIGGIILTFLLKIPRPR